MKRAIQIYLFPLAIAALAIPLMLALGAAPQPPAPQPSAAAPPAPPAPPSPAAQVNVVGFTPVAGEVFEGRAVFFFDREIAPPVAEDGTELATIEFEPKLPGKYSHGSNYVAFEAEGRPAEQGATFKAHLRNIRGKNGEVLSNPGNAYVLATYSLYPKDVALQLQTDESYLLRLEFERSIRLDVLQQHLSVTDGAGASVKYTLEESPGNQNAYLLTLPASAPLPFQITISKGLQDSSGQQSTSDAYSVRFPSETPFTVESVLWRSPQSRQHYIDIRFASPVPSASLEKHLTIKDAATGREIQVNSLGSTAQDNYRITLKESLNGVRRLRLELHKGLAAQGLSVLTEEYAVILIREPDPLTITYQRWDQRGVEGAVLTMNFNDTVQAETIQDGLTFEPPVKNLKVNPGNWNQSLDVRADWKTGQQYRMTLAEGVESSNGTHKVVRDQTITLENVPKVGGVAFSDSGKLYFPRRAAGFLNVEARNLPKATVTVWELFPNNLTAAMKYLDEDRTHGGFNSDLARRLDQKVLEFPQSADERVSMPLDVRGLLPADRRGVFSVQLSPARDYQDTKVVLWTDIGALAHWQDDALMVFAHDLYTLEPLDRAKVTVYSQKNQSMGTTYTGAGGVAEFQSLDTALGAPAVVVVETANDYTFLKLDTRSEGSEGLDASMPRYNREGYDAFLYADRNLYRPGETVHARWIVRTNYGDAPGEVPLQVRLLNPKGVEMLAEPTTLSALGSGGKDFDTKTSDLTGKYTVELRVPKSTVLGRYTFNIEEFVPNRIRTEVKTAEDVWAAGGAEHAVEVEAQHLFGAPAANRKCEASVILRPADYTNKDWPGYRFGNESDFAVVLESLGEKQTDSAGKAAFSYRYQPVKAATFPLRATVRAQVFEVGGRSVAASKDVTLFPSDVLVGVKITQGEDRKLRVDAVALAPDGTPAKLDKISISLEARNWSYYLRRYSGYDQPGFTEYFDTLSTVEVTLQDGRGTYVFDRPGYGYYRVRVHSDKTPQYSTVAFYTYWSRIRIADAEEASLIKLKLDKESYAPGDEVTLRVESPFDGRGIVVLQGDDIEQVLPVLIRENSGEVKFIVTRAFAPNIWAEATIIHASQPGEAQVYPYSSFAMISVPVREAERVLTVRYPGLPEEVRPAQPVSFEVETLGHDGAPVSAEVTLAVVDEGIHGILGYANPDPASYFSRPRSPDFRRAHYYDKVAYDFEAPDIGGDMLRKRLSKDDNVDENWIKPLALWSGSVTTGADGKTAVHFELPEFNGQVRLVAVAATANATGAQAADLYVRRPYLLRTSMPRFALPGDAFDCRAVLFNTTDQPVNVRVAWRTEGTLLPGPGGQTFLVQPKAEAEVLAHITAGQEIGQGRILWEAEVSAPSGALLEKLSEDAPLPVRRPAAFESKNELIMVKPSEERSFTNTDFLDNSLQESKISVSANPSLQLEEALGFLKGYPYGCVEQTTSRCMPMYLLRTNAALVASAFGEHEQLGTYLQAGIDRLFTMQTSEGGLGYWPGSNEVYDYGSVYAGHFLTLARADGGLVVPEAAFKALQNHLVRIVQQGGSARASDLYMRAYACYVLALDGRQEGVDAIGRFDTLAVPESARYLLAAALAMHTADPDRVKRYLETTPTVAYPVRETYGTLNSEGKSQAVELLALLEMDTPQTELSRRATLLLQFLKERYHYTTHETAFVVTALGRYLEKLGSDATAVDGTITGPDGTAQVAPKTIYTKSAAGKNAVYTVRNTGSVPVYVNWTTAGIPSKHEMTTVAEGLTISRKFLQQGKPVAQDHVFLHGDAYVVDLEFACKSPLFNIVIADLLPAGFEIENPRLDPDALAAEGMQGSVTPSYLEVRDDRLVLAFNQLTGRETFHFYYVVRAVTPGQFQQPPVHAECMYEPAVRATSLPAEIEVRTR